MRANCYTRNSVNSFGSSDSHHANFFVLAKRSRGLPSTSLFVTYSIGFPKFVVYYFIYSRIFIFRIINRKRIKLVRLPSLLNETSWSKWHDRVAHGLFLRYALTLCYILWWQNNCNWTNVFELKLMKKVF